MDLQVGDAVEITHRDLKHECAYKGQQGCIIKVHQIDASVHLRCGHIWNVLLTSLQKIDAINTLAVIDQLEEIDDWQHDVCDEE